MTRWLEDPTLFVERALVAGLWIDAADGATIDVDDPATGSALGSVPALGALDTHAA